MEHDIKRNAETGEILFENPVNRKSRRDHKNRK